MAPEGWHPEDIKAAVRKTGITLTQLAIDSGLDPSACRCALSRPYPRGNRAIAQYINVPMHQLWPEWFDAQGNRIRSLRKNTRSRAPVQCRTSAASQT